MEGKKVVTSGGDAYCERILILSFLAGGEGAASAKTSYEIYNKKDGPRLLGSVSLRSWKASPGEEPRHAKPSQVGPQAPRATVRTHLEEPSSDSDLRLTDLVELRPVLLSVSCLSVRSRGTLKT